MTQNTQDAHTTRVKDLLPSGELDEITGDVTPTESSTTLWKRRRRALELVSELEGLEKAQGYSNQFLQQAWMNAGGTMPDKPAPGLSEITGDTVTGAPSREDFANMLNQAEFTTALEQGLVSAREADQVRLEEEARQRTRDEAKAGSAFGAAQVTQAEVGEETLGAIGEKAQSAAHKVAWAELLQNLVGDVDSNILANQYDLGPGAGERREQRLEGIKDNDFWRWANNEISDDMFVDALSKQVDEATAIDEI